MTGFLECYGCGGILAGRRKKWCSSTCEKKEARRKHIRTCFNLSLEEYEIIFEEQQGRCGICGKKPGSGKSLAVDHAHTDGRSGPVRGLLCFYCNRRLIGARSDEAILKMADYITDPPAIRALGKEVIAPGRPVKKRQPRKRKRGA